MSNLALCNMYSVTVAVRWSYAPHMWDEGEVYVAVEDGVQEAIAFASSHIMDLVRKVPCDDDMEPHERLDGDFQDEDGQWWHAGRCLEHRVTAVHEIAANALNCIDLPVPVEQGLRAVS